MYNIVFYGAIAQLGERLNGIQEVRGSIPRSSTNITLVFYFLQRYAILYVYILYLYDNESIRDILWNLKLVY